MTCQVELDQILPGRWAALGVETRPGPVGGVGRGPNPPGPVGGVGRGPNPPGPVGGVGRGPNPPGPVGGVGRRNGVGLMR